MTLALWLAMAAAPGRAAAARAPDAQASAPQALANPFQWLQRSGRPVFPPAQVAAVRASTGATGRGLDSYRNSGRLLDPAPVPAPPPAPRSAGGLPADERRVPLVSDAFSCVPYARAASGINLVGDAATWWDKAATAYARGQRPELGAVLAFPAVAHMPLGHVAVVSRVLGPRLITVDHANWAGARNSIVRAVPVLDVSPANDWTQVRLTVADNGEFGSVYQSFGFIYRRPAALALAGR